MKKIISLGAVLAPSLAFAAGTSQTVFGVVAIINQILAILIPVLITLAVVYFIWGVIQYTVSGDEEKKKSARGMIISGLIGLFVIIAFWGIIKVVTNTFGVTGEQLDTSQIPCIPNAQTGVTCP